MGGHKTSVELLLDLNELCPASGEDGGTRCKAGLVVCRDQPRTAEMLYGASGKLVGIGSSLPWANALARRYI